MITRRLYVRRKTIGDLLFVIRQEGEKTVIESHKPDLFITVNNWIEYGYQDLILEEKPDGAKRWTGKYKVYKSNDPLFLYKLGAYLHDSFNFEVEIKESTEVPLG